MTNILDRSIAPAIHTIDRFYLPEVKTISFSNDNILHHLSLTDSEVVRLEWNFEAGSILESKNGAAFICAKMLTEGTSNKSGNVIQEQLALYGAFIEVQSSIHLFTVTLFCLRKHIDNLLPIIEDLLLNANFPIEAFNKQIKIHRQSFLVNLEKTSFVASNTFRENLFGKSHPYGKIQSLESIDGLEINDIINHYHKNILNTFCRITATGAVDDVLINKLQNIWGTKATQKNSFSFDYNNLETNTTKIYIPKDNCVQSSLRIGKAMPNIHHKDATLISITNEILGGYFGSRLMQNIREDKGYTYGIHSSIVTMKNYSYLVVGTDTKAEFTNETIAEINNELNKLIQEPVSAEELEAVRNYMLGTFINDIQNIFAIADKNKTLITHNLNYSYFQKVFDTIKTVSSEEIQNCASIYFNPSDLLEVVVGKK
jgi:predicted Zn-dependent peptidase